MVVSTELVTEGSEDMHPENNVLSQNVTIRRLAKLELRGTVSPYRVVFQVQFNQSLFKDLENFTFFA